MPFHRFRPRGLNSNVGAAYRQNDGSDNYRALALYAADAAMGKFQGEKTLHSWYAGGVAENYLEGMIEVEATQARNTRTQTAKTYHLMVSFRPEDEAKLSPQIFQEIEKIFAAALGFTEHQRHCGVHMNTDNLHMHIAYNKINPQKFTSLTPHNDNLKLSQAARFIEQKFGLVVDKGVEPGQPKQVGRAGAKVKSLEAQTGQESFFSYVLRHKLELMAIVSRLNILEKASFKFGQIVTDIFF